MGKSTGFIEYGRAQNSVLAPEERIKSWGEFRTMLCRADRQTQGARCMNCGVPFCQSGVRVEGAVSGCPLHNLIPEWNDEIYRGNWGQALARLCKTDNFPEFTGRVCPALCESACTCGLYDSPVTVKENELAIIETGFAEGRMTPRRPGTRSGKKVAVIGSGPSGLAAADMLNMRGHCVTVFERDAKCGGLLMYGIPNMKLEKSVVLRRIKLMEAEGVCFRTGCDVGAGVSASDILRDFDAVILCCGARQPRTLDVPGSDIEGVYFAVDFLSDATRSLIGEKVEHPVSAKGKNVLVIGGGDTGNDCVATCVRQGCASVRQLVRKPMPPVARPENNGWPQVSRAFKTDYGQEEAKAVFGSDPRAFKTKVKELICDERGCLIAAKIIESEPEKDESGRLIMREKPESETVVPCELLLIAAGFSGCSSYVAEAFGAELDRRGNLVTDGKYATSVPKLFAAGDARRGSSLVVWAIAEGRACAKEADRLLMGYTNMV